ncbi:MAG TPA: hypothetical protein VGA60_00540 [Kiloniellales bacterium]
MTGRSTRRYSICWRSRVPAAVLACVFSVVLCAVAPGPGAADGAGFVAGVEDLPLMAGLADVANAGVVFDKPGGRIVEAYAEGAVSRADVLGFYRQTLPQLGWQTAGETAFTREGERLEIVILGSDGDLVVRFTLQPD